MLASSGTNTGHPCGARVSDLPRMYHDGGREAKRGTTGDGEVLVFNNAKPNAVTAKV